MLATCWWWWVGDVDKLFARRHFEHRPICLFSRLSVCHRSSLDSRVASFGPVRSRGTSAFNMARWLLLLALWCAVLQQCAFGKKKKKKTARPCSDVFDLWEKKDFKAGLDLATEPRCSVELSTLFHVPEYGSSFINDGK